MDHVLFRSIVCGSSTVAIAASHYPIHHQANQTDSRNNTVKYHDSTLLNHKKPVDDCPYSAEYSKYGVEEASHKTLHVVRRLSVNKLQSYIIILYSYERHKNELEPAFL